MKKFSLNCLLHYIKNIKTEKDIMKLWAGPKTHIGN